MGRPVRQEEFPGSNKGNAENTLSISYSVVQLFWVVLRILAGSCKILAYLVIVSLVEVMWELWSSKTELDLDVFVREKDLSGEVGNKYGKECDGPLCFG